MFKKLCIATLVISLCCVFVACASSRRTLVERYTTTVGEKVFVKTASQASYGSVYKMTLPEGCSFVNALTDKLFLVQKEDESALFGLANVQGELLIECKYSTITASGNFLCAGYLDDSIPLTDEDLIYGTASNYVNDFYYADGVKLMDVNGDVSFEAIDDTYCALYYDGYAQVFDKNGLYYFNDRNHVSANFHFSFCDGWLFGHDSSRGDWFIWELNVQNGGDAPAGESFIRAFYTADAHTVYALGYMGNGLFAVLESRYASADDFDYKEEQNGETYYFKQSAYLFDPALGSQKQVQTEAPVFGFINVYSPDLSLAERGAVNVTKGYSTVSAAVLGEDKSRLSSAYYVVDENLNFILRYPQGITSSAMTFKEGYGFAGEASENYAAALYYLNCDPVWIRSDARYYGQSYNYGCYVAAKVNEEGLRYGVLDAKGEEKISFAYEFIAPFTQTGSVAIRNGQYVRLSAAGAEETIEDIYDDKTLLYYGVYGYLQNEKIGVKNFNGEVLVPAAYDSVLYIGIMDGVLYLHLGTGETSEVYTIKPL